MIFNLIIGIAGIGFAYLGLCCFIMIFDETRRPLPKPPEENREIGNAVTAGALLFPVLGAVAILFALGTIK